MRGMLRKGGRKEEEENEKEKEIEEDDESKYNFRCVFQVSHQSSP